MNCININKDIISWLGDFVKFFWKKYFIVFEIEKGNRICSGRTAANSINHIVTKEKDSWSIRHKQIKPFTPRHNDKVERSPRKNNEEEFSSFIPLTISKGS